MKPWPLFLTIALTFAVVLLVSGLAAQRKAAGREKTLSAANPSQTLAGVISDAICGRDHAMAGKSDTECTRECVRRGSQHALIVGEKTYILDGGPANKLHEFAGIRVLVSGIVQGEIIHVESVVAEPPEPSHPKQ